MHLCGTRGAPSSVGGGVAGTSGGVLESSSAGAVLQQGLVKEPEGRRSQMASGGECGLMNSTMTGDGAGALQTGELGCSPGNLSSGSSFFC